MGRNPHREGDRVVLEIDKLAYNGFGLGRAAKVVFLVPRAVPGDRLEVEVTHAKRSYCEAEPRAVLRPSPDRIAPVCADFGRCGGCAHLDMAYEAQLRHKGALLREFLRAHPGARHEPFVASPPLAYRNKMLMSLAPEKEAESAADDVGGRRPTGRVPRLVSGFYSRRSHRIVDPAYCHLQPPEVNALRRRFADLAPLHLPTQHLDLLTHLLIRTTGAGEHLLAIVARGPVDLGPLSDALMAEFPNLVTTLLFLNGAGGNVPFDRKPGNPFAADPLRVVRGPGFVVERVAGVDFPLGPEAFFQVNRHTVGPMVEAVRDFAGSGGALLDLYSGAGFFGLTLRPRFDRVYFVDDSAPAIDTLRARAAADPGLSPILGDAAAAAAALARDGVRLDAAVIDPPRAGLEPSLSATIARLGPRRLVMVSCQPATLARDLTLLATQGYRVETVRPIDNFPQTSHLECVTRLDRAETADD